LIFFNLLRIFFQSGDADAGGHDVTRIVIHGLCRLGIRSSFDWCTLLGIVVFLFFLALSTYLVTLGMVYGELRNRGFILHINDVSYKYWKSFKS